MPLPNKISTILKPHSTGLHVTEITKQLITQSLWTTKGKTPAATIAAKLYTHIKQNGKASPFIQTAPQTFVLKANFTSTPIKSTKPKGKLSFVNSAEKILKDYANKQPMHYRVITEKALELNLLDTGGLSISE